MKKKIAPLIAIISILTIIFLSRKKVGAVPTEEEGKPPPEERPSIPPCNKYWSDRVKIIVESQPPPSMLGEIIETICLRFGRIDKFIAKKRFPEQPDEIWYWFRYSMPGYAANTWFIHIDEFRIYMNNIVGVADENIQGLQYYIDLINQGYCVGACNSGAVFAELDCDKVVEACELWQEGFNRFLSAEHFRNKMKPYEAALTDVDTIQQYINKEKGL